MKKKVQFRRMALLLFMLMGALTISAQSRSYIKEAIKKNGECRNVAITKTNGDLMLYGRNGCARSGCPKGLNDAIVELNNAQEYIDDVQLTENGRWLILYGNNGFLWNDIPYSLERQLREYNNEGETVLSVTFNDAGDWAIVSTEHVSASETWIQDWLKEGMRNYGMLWTVCITDDAMVAVFEDGYKFYGNVPETLKTALNKTRIDVFRLKIAGTAWFFSDGKSRYDYYM